MSPARAQRTRSRNPPAASAPEVEVITAPEYGGRNGLVVINGKHYLVRCWGLSADDGFRVAPLTGDRREYDLHVTPYGHLVCDCPDATYRERACKHSLAVGALRLKGLL